MSRTVELTDEQIERIARRVAQLIMPKPTIISVSTATAIPTNMTTR
jgi:hypothetical protein